MLKFKSPNVADPESHALELVVLRWWWCCCRTVRLRRLRLVFCCEVMCVRSVGWPRCGIDNRKG